MSENPILLSVSDGVAEITLNRPDKLNSFNEAMFQALFDALKTVEREETIRCLLLTGAGRGFCAGQDLSGRVQGNSTEAPDLSKTLDATYNPLIRRIKALPKPVICAVNGVAAGAGANIALACDIVIAAKSASFLQAFCKIGLIPDAGGTWALPRLVGMARAKGLALLGDKLPAEQAAAWGLIWACVEDEALMQQARTMAAQLAAGPTKGYALTKRALETSFANRLDDQLDLERDLQGIAGRSEDYREGVAAFMEKRKPAFKGR